jgi:hypothetical protein
MNALEAAAKEFREAENELTAQIQSRSENAVTTDLPGYARYTKARNALCDAARQV